MTTQTGRARVKQSPHFFAREPDGTVRLRIRFQPDEASMIEEAAGATPVMLWIHKTIREAAKAEVLAQREAMKDIAPPPE
jgi:hypothetical protein